MAVHSSLQTSNGFSHIEGISLGAGKEIYEVIERTGMNTFKSISNNNNP